MHLSHHNPHPLHLTFQTLIGLTLLTLSANISASTTVFINEFHYDNTGSDKNEAIEIAGPGGQDLSGWQLLFYNGNGGSQYGSADLTGTIPDLNTGFGTLSFAASGLQNGPDGLALTNASNQVIQFISYENSFIATDGPGTGLLSELVGVSEDGSTTDLESLQLIGTGRFYEDFQWTGPTAQSFGALNQGQTITPAMVPIPAALPLFLSGLAGLGILSRRKNRHRPTALAIKKM